MTDPHLIEQAEVDAWVELQTSLADEARCRFGIEVHRRGSAVVLVGHRTEFPAFNRTLGFGLDRPLDGAQLDGIIEIYRAARVRLFLVQWAPAAAPADAHALFLSRGFRAGSRMAKLCRRTTDAPLPDSPFDVVPVSEADAACFARLLVDAHGNDPELEPAFRSTVGRPGWTHYVALDGGRPVAGAALHARRDVAWCGMAATLERDRGRGAHRALLARRIRDAARAGCSWISCETMEDTPERPNPSYHNMREAGFELRYLRTNYIFDARG